MLLQHFQKGSPKNCSHSGRGTYINLALSAGVDPWSIAISTKHKNPKSLLTYADASNSSLAAGSLQAAKKLRRNNPGELCGEIVEDPCQVSTELSSECDSIATAAPSRESSNPSQQNIFVKSSSSSSSSLTLMASSSKTTTVVNKSYQFHFN